MTANFVLLERIELNASASSISFTNIPQSGYTDLKVVISSRSDRSLNYDFIYCTFNGSSSNFSGKLLEGNGASAASYNITDNQLGITNANTATANTFASMDMYIPNYTGSQQKSFTLDNVQETNGTTAYADLRAGLWANTAAITSMTFSVPLVPSNFMAGSTFSLYGLAAVGTTPAIAPKASGGNITTDGTYWIHTFLTTGTFVPQTSLSCDYLVVAGGGGGGSAGSNSVRGAGGGGAGGYRTFTSQNISTTQTITIGAGGAGAPASSRATGSNGTNSSMGSSAATAGGGGSGEFLTAGNGGSGGGAGDGGTRGTGNAGSYSPVEGYAGGLPGGGAVNDGAGGGGSAAVGSNGSSLGSGGAGGAGTSNSITGTATTYAVGGNGGSYNSGATGASGTTNRGNGGGGAAGSSGGYVAGGAGGSGIVIIRYPIN